MFHIYFDSLPILVLFSDGFFKISTSVNIEVKYMYIDIRLSPNHDLLQKKRWGELALELSVMLLKHSCKIFFQC